MALWLGSERRKRRRKKWQPPNNPTLQARAIWRHVYPGDPWPRGWKVEWAGFMRNTVGLTLWESRRILLNYADARRGRNIVCTLVHEFIHVRFPQLRHGKDFERLVQSGCHRLGDWRAS